MSYCVNCGVELDPTARACPLCHTPVVNPNQPVDTALPPPFPSRREEVQPVSKKELALLLKALVSMYRQSPKGAAAYAIMAGAFVLTAFAGVDAVLVILMCGAIGLASSLQAKRRAA